MSRLSEVLAALCPPRCPECGYSGILGKWDRLGNVMRWRCPGGWFDIGCGTRWSETAPRQWGTRILTGQAKAVAVAMGDRIKELEKKVEAAGERKRGAK